MKETLTIANFTCVCQTILFLEEYSCLLKIVLWRWWLAASLQGSTCTLCCSMTCHTWWWRGGIPPCWTLRVIIRGASPSAWTRKKADEIPSFGMMTRPLFRSALDVAATVSIALRIHPPVKLYMSSQCAQLHTTCSTFELPRVYPFHSRAYKTCILHGLVMVCSYWNSSKRFFILTDFCVNKKVNAISAYY